MAEMVRLPEQQRRRPLTIANLPEEILSEILLLLPPKSILQCRAVCKVWRDVTSDRAFLLPHHCRQPPQRLLTFIRDVGSRHDDLDILDYCVEAVDFRTHQFQSLARFTGQDYDCSLEDSPFTVHASCDGLLLMSYNNYLHLCNPTTRQWLWVFPPALQHDTVLGLYSHGHSSEYRVLYYREIGLGPEFYISIVGSGKERSIWPHSSSASLRKWLAKGKEETQFNEPFLFHGNLHWLPHLGGQNKIVVFDTLDEVFRWLHVPFKMHNMSSLLEIEGSLAMSNSHIGSSKVDLWLLQDYKHMVWVHKYRIELPVIEIRRFEEDDGWNRVTSLMLSTEARSDGIQQEQPRCTWAQQPQPQPQRRQHSPAARPTRCPRSAAATRSRSRSRRASSRSSTVSSSPPASRATPPTSPSSSASPPLSSPSPTASASSSPPRSRPPPSSPTPSSSPPPPPGCLPSALSLYALLFLSSSSPPLLRPNAFTYPPLFRAAPPALALALATHSIKFLGAHAASCDRVLGAALLDVFARCGRIASCRKVFDRIANPDLPAWNALLSAYARLRARDVACASSAADAILEMFVRMLSLAIKPNEITLVAVIGACGELGAVSHGVWAHTYAVKRRLAVNCIVATALVEMYAGCGRLDLAEQVFAAASDRDTRCYNAMLHGLAVHGHGRAALSLFDRMHGEGVPVDGVTVLSVMCACAHAGLVDEGLDYFDRMEIEFGIEPSIEHYGCMVDMLSRAGRLNDAEKLIHGMPIVPNAAIYRSLIRACGIHGKLELGKKMIAELMRLEPDDSGNHVLISNFYATTNRWDDAKKARRR
ncbi:hypothetical protein OsJ_32820 [Oryza sativa Japonica Group]|uniref:F-box domain-containing protein n=1 Tax=Oryza sativa subsp. japonica TaxID=39947 RepID=A3C887_ORYSJ|nr:hypothetical protein OsJ_32820 [Oryza sativa Japonica Group]